MLSFLSCFAPVVSGILSGLDRLFLCGTLRNLSYNLGLQNYLWNNHIPFKDFKSHSLEVTDRLEEASLEQARRLGREIRYLNSSEIRKEDLAREIAARDHIKSGLICVLRCVDPCMSFQINANHDTHKLQIHYRQRKCMHLYHYQIHPVFGFMHARIQTWFPFRIYVCLNGREWLARQMDQAGLRYLRRDNTFTWLEDLARTQALFEQQLQANWPTLLGGLAAELNPAHDAIFANYPCRYYWSVQDSEWASDVMFRSRAALEKVYPPMLRYAVCTFAAVDVLRFLGQPVGASGKVPFHCRHEVSTNLKERVEGVRLKHWLNKNSLKIYDKGSVLRVETMLRQPEDFKVYRPAEGQPEGPLAWRPLRRGIADLHRRATVSQAANERYLEALAAVHDRTPVRQLAEPLCAAVVEPARPRAAGTEKAASDSGRPQPAPLAPEGTTAPPVAESVASAPSVEGPPAAAVAESVASTVAESTTSAPPVAAVRSASPMANLPRKERRRRVRALNPLGRSDGALLEAVGRHEFMINGLRNRDLRRLLYSGAAPTVSERKKRCAAVTRQLRLLRGHGVLQKVPRTHRYLVSERGRQAITALLALRNAGSAELIRCAG
jgi:hypothetical protein